MKTKYCACCNNTLPVLSFNKRGDGLQPFCKECNKIKSREYYLSNRQAHLSNIAAQKQYKKTQFKTWKATLKCSICPESYVGCLDFHHLDPSKKDMNISSAFKDVGLITLIAELRKCAVLCANCHRKVHDGVIDSSFLVPLTDDKMLKE